VFVEAKQRLTQHVPRAKRRCCLTHVGIICDQVEIQPRLPQVILGNGATFLARAMPGLRRACPANVVLLRRKSAWNDKVVCAWLIRRLGLALAPSAERYQPVLLLDAYKTHYARPVLLACRRAGIWVVLVPARLTWLIQPLDTHGFQRYKAHLREQYQQACIRHAGGPLSVADFLPCVYSAVRSVLQGTVWAQSFLEDGFGDQQASLRARVLCHFDDATSAQAPLTRPSGEELAQCFPRRATVPADLLWHPFDAPLAPPVMPVPRVRLDVAARRRGAAAASDATIAAREPRTRAEHRAAAAATVATTSAASSSSPSGAAIAFPASPAASALPSAPRVFGRTRSQTRLLMALRKP
jgi:hypothetical protein